MGLRRSPIWTLIKLSPLYVLVGFLLYFLIFVDKELDYLAMGSAHFSAREFPESLHYLNMAVEKKAYRGSDLLEVLFLRARVLNIMKGHHQAIRDLDEILKLRPHWSKSIQVRALKGEIHLGRDQFAEALEIFEGILADLDEEEEEQTRFMYRGKAAAAAYNFSSGLMEQCQDLLFRNLSEYDREMEIISEYITDLNNSYDRAYLETHLQEHLSENNLRELIGLATDSRRYYHYAFKMLKDCPTKGFFDPTASIFLSNILYRSKHYLPALLECSLAVKEPLRILQRRGFLQIMANIYWDLECYGMAAGILEEIRKPAKIGGPIDLLRNIVLLRLKNGDFQQVIKEGENHLASGGGDLVVKYCLGAAYLMNNEIDQAIPLLKEVLDSIKSGKAPAYLAESPVRKSNFERLKEAYVLAKSHLPALEVLSFSIDFYPEELTFWRERARLLDETLHQYAEASRDYLHLLRHGPRDLEIFQDWIRTTELNFQVLTGFTYSDRARQLIDKFERQRSVLSRDEKRLPELAIAASFPEANNEPPLKLALSDEFLRRGDREQSKSMLRNLTRTMPDILEFNYRLGCRYFQEGDAKRALREFEKILVRDTHDFETVRKTLACYRASGDSLNEGRLVQTLLKEKADGLDGWMLARLKFERGKREKFLEMYESLDALPRMARDDLDRMAAQCYLDQGHIARAESLVKPILDGNPRDVESLLIMARILLKKPEGASELEGLIDKVHAMGMELNPVGLKAFCLLFAEEKQPRLFIRLFEELKTPFPIPPEIHQLAAEAYQQEGDYEKSAEILLAHGTSRDDLIQAFALGLLRGEGLDLAEQIMDRVDSEGWMGEFALCAAGTAALMGNIQESRRRLDQAQRYTDHGRFSPYEVEYIDFLSRSLNQYTVLGLYKPGKTAPAQAEGDEGQPPQETGVEDPPVEASEVEPEDTAALTGDTPTEPVNAEVGEASDDHAAEGEGDRTPPAASPGRKGGLLALLLPPAPEKDGADETDTTGTKIEPWTADQVVLDDLPMSQRYSSALPETLRLVNTWQAEPDKNVAIMQGLLFHLLLRHLPRFETECLQAAEKVRFLDPACGLAMRYIFEREASPDLPRQTVTMLTLPAAAVPEDHKTLSLLAPAFAKMNLAALSQGCMAQVEKTNPDPLETKMTWIRVHLAGGDVTSAMKESNILLNEAVAAEQTEVLKDLVPLLIELKATKGIHDVLIPLQQSRSLDEKTVERILAYLEKTPPAAAEQALATRLFQGPTFSAKFRLMALLARQYQDAEDWTRLEEIAAELMDALQKEPLQDPDGLHEAFQIVGFSMAQLDRPHEALVMFEHAFFLRPEASYLLAVMAEMAEKVNNIRKATEYLEIHRLLNPWEVRTKVKLVRNWFFELGQFKKAFDLASTDNPLLRADTELAIQVQAGYRFIQGRPEEAVLLIKKFGYREKLASPTIMFFMASMYYILDEYELAYHVFDRLIQDFDKDPWAKKGSYLKGRSEPHLSEEGKKGKAGKKTPPRQKDRATTGNN